MERLERFELRPFAFRKARVCSYKWVPYALEEGALVDSDPYGKEIAPGAKILFFCGEDEGIEKVEFPIDMGVSEGRKSPCVPLWQIFGEMPLDEEAFLSFADFYGQLGPHNLGNFRTRRIRNDPKPNGENGSIIRISGICDTLEFWRREVATFKALLTLDKAIADNDHKTLGKIVHAGPNGQTHFWLGYSYQGERVKCFASQSTSPKTWKAAGGTAPFDPVRVAKAFCLDIVSNRLTNFPVELGLLIGGDLIDIDNLGVFAKLPEVASPVLTPSCLLGAMYWSFAQKLLGNLEYRQCSVCGKMGYIGGRKAGKQMVKRDNGSWVHMGTEYDSLKKSESRKKAKERKIAAGEQLRKPGRPPKAKKKAPSGA